MGLIASILVKGEGRLPQPLRFVATALRHPIDFLRSLSVRHWSEKSVILLVMQSIDNSLRLFAKKGLFGTRIASTQGHGQPNPTWLPVGHEAARAAAEALDGMPAASINESLLGIPMTAHILGGAVIGAGPGAGGHRPLPPGARPPRAVRDGRGGGQRQPGIEPLAHHHRPGGAGGGHVAQQGRAGPAPRPRRALPAGGPGPAAAAGGPGRRPGGPEVVTEPEVALRPARPDEAAALAEISRRAFDSDLALGMAPGPGGPPGYASPDWQAQMMLAGRYHAVTVDGALAGGAIVFGKGAGHCELGRLFLDPQWHGQGIGKQAHGPALRRLPGRACAGPWTPRPGTAAPGPSTKAWASWPSGNCRHPGGPDLVLYERRGGPPASG